MAMTSHQVSAGHPHPTHTSSESSSTKIMWLVLSRPISLIFMASWGSSAPVSQTQTEVLGV